MESRVNIESCCRREYQKGYKIPIGSFNMPMRSYGSYLPGDEPGEYCSITGEPCSNNFEISLDNCPRMELLGVVKDPEDEDQNITVWYDEDKNQYYCVEFGSWYSKSEMVEFGLESICF